MKLSDPISVRLAEPIMNRIDLAVEQGSYKDRSDAIRAILEEHAPHGKAKPNGSEVLSWRAIPLRTRSAAPLGHQLARLPLDVTMELSTQPIDSGGHGCLPIGLVADGPDIDDFLVTDVRIGGCPSLLRSPVPLGSRGSFGPSGWTSLPVSIPFRPLRDLGLPMTYGEKPQPPPQPVITLPVLAWPTTLTVEIRRTRERRVESKPPSPWIPPEVTKALSDVDLLIHGSPTSISVIVVPVEEKELAIELLRMELA
jgi:hypothetical protein